MPNAEIEIQDTSLAPGTFQVLRELPLRMDTQTLFSEQEKKIATLKDNLIAAISSSSNPNDPATASITDKIKSLHQQLQNEINEFNADFQTKLDRLERHAKVLPPEEKGRQLMELGRDYNRLLSDAQKDLAESINNLQTAHIQDFKALGMDSTAINNIVNQMQILGASFFQEARSSMHTAVKKKKEEQDALEQEFHYQQFTDTRKQQNEHLRSQGVINVGDLDDQSESFKAAGTGDTVYCVKQPNHMGQESWTFQLRHRIVASEESRREDVKSMLMEAVRRNKKTPITVEVRHSLENFGNKTQYSGDDFVDAIVKLWVEIWRRAQEERIRKAADELGIEIDFKNPDTKLNKLRDKLNAKKIQNQAIYTDLIKTDAARDSLKEKFDKVEESMATLSSVQNDTPKKLESTEKAIESSEALMRQLEEFLDFLFGRTEAAIQSTDGSLRQSIFEGIHTDLNTSLDKDLKTLETHLKTLENTIDDLRKDPTVADQADKIARLEASVNDIKNRRDQAEREATDLNRQLKAAITQEENAPSMPKP